MKKVEPKGKGPTEVPKLKLDILASKRREGHVSHNISQLSLTNNSVSPSSIKPHPNLMFNYHQNKVKLLK